MSDSSNTSPRSSTRRAALEYFRRVFDYRFLNTVVSLVSDNEAKLKRILHDEEFHQVLMDLYSE